MRNEATSPLFGFTLTTLIVIQGCLNPRIDEGLLRVIDVDSKRTHRKKL